jgi:hypothetical protein
MTLSINYTMKRVFVFKEKFRLALCLTVIFAVSLLAGYFIHINVAQADESLGSLYRDRIIPTKDIFEIQNRLYENQMLLLELINTVTQGEADQIGGQLEGNNEVIDSLVSKFEKTLLVPKESWALAQYHHLVKDYRGNQQVLLQLSRQGSKREAALLYHQQAHASFTAVSHTVQQLASLQATVGGELYNHSHLNLMGAELLAYLVVGVTIAIGLIALSLLKTTSLPGIHPYKASLN